MLKKTAAQERDIQNVIDQIIEDSKPILDIIEDAPSTTIDKAHEEAREAQGEQSNEEANEPDMANPDTWPKVPTDKPLTVGLPSRKKPRERGEKSLYDSEGGEWRLHKPDEFYRDAHYDYKPKNGSWKEVPIAVEN